MAAHVYNSVKYARFHKAQIRNICNVENQALSFVKVLSETQLWTMIDETEIYTDLQNEDVDAMKLTFGFKRTSIIFPNSTKQRKTNCRVREIKRF